MAGLIQRHGSVLVRRFLASGKRITRNSLATARFHTSTQLDKRVSFNLSDIGEGIREVTVKEWFVSEGDTVEQFDNLCEVQSDKASVTITSRYEGKIVKLHKQVDQIAMVGSPLLDFDVDDEEQVSDDNSNSSSDTDEDVPAQAVAVAAGGGHGVKVALTPCGKVLATPAVRRIAMEHKVDLHRVKPTGRSGRVLKGDVLEYLNMIPEGTVKPHPTLLRTQPTASPEVTDLRQLETIVPIKGVAKIMVKSMTECLKIPHFAYSDELDVSKLVSLREDLKAEAQAQGIKLTYMPFFVKAASNALKQFPILNSTFDEANERLIYKSYHNISIAMHTPQGLVVPNVKNVERKSILEIATDINSLQERGSKGSLTPNDFANGTLSLSNIGMVGGTYTHPCILAPQVAIGAIGQTRLLPRFNASGQVIAAHIMVVSWSADHRVIDGVTMASFSNAWKKLLEKPQLFLLDAK
ncbi:lipoamide acyltransferase component of branched-chain alpha-keto acid dehydrogenase complex, mitochondrial [Topomyia yanbarensis]|uniref:lipoamide acyltransferase component of branched-chain alpha-keto acid dehydrogenase complex, mitochondrial n=1 Tax=Topomyia yanbarensis TaxID=2498891 RepID=UPI00273A8934|nr:lipoamide acyltransferase component of branched-chain alpha-keto acid dehydrogenase complex, mitochondrial [Topomyia yanbarensis]